jgi:flagellar protein FliS
MFGMTQNPTAAYAQVSLESVVNTADPHGLILLLFEGAATAMSLASLHMEQNNIALRGANISKAIDIITNGLKASLDLKVSGDLAERLYALYEYIVQRLLWANMRNDRAALDEATFLLGEIHSAWAEMPSDRQNI